MGHPAQMAASRWSAPIVPGKSVEVRRSQMDDLFKSLRSGDELTGIEPRQCTPPPRLTKQIS